MLAVASMVGEGVRALAGVGGWLLRTSQTKLLQRASVGGWSTRTGPITPDHTIVGDELATYTLRTEENLVVILTDQTPDETMCLPKIGFE